MAKKRRHLFKVRSPLGYNVILTRDRWRQIIRQKHPALAGRDKDVRECLKSPVTIRECSKDPNVHLHCLPSENVYLCVVSAPADNHDHFVVTAFFTNKVKMGSEIWTS